MQTRRDNHQPLNSIILHYQSSKMNRSRLQLSRSQPQEPLAQIFITHDQFNLFLQTLSQEQAQQLSRVAQYHPLIQYDSQRRLFKGTGNIMLELSYLIQQATLHDITSIQTSFSQPSEPTIIKQIFQFHALNITEGNYKAMVRDLYSVRANPHNVFQLAYEDKEVVYANRDAKNTHFKLAITNRCSKNKRIFMIFQKIHQILQFQTLIDSQIRLNDISFLIQQIQQIESQTNSLFQTPIAEDQHLYCFKRTTLKDWPKLINNINKLFQPDDIIIMKFKHFHELIQHQKFFLKPIRIAVDEGELDLPVSKIAHCKVLANNTQSIHRVKETALKLLEQGLKHLKAKDYLLDELNCFNYYILQSRKAKSMYTVKQSPNNKKTYIYFVFYQKLFQIQRDADKKIVQLLEKKNIREEITDKYFTIALENIIKHAVINELPFFMLYEQPAGVDNVCLEEVQFQKQDDFTHLLAYEYILATPKYKIDTDPSYLKPYLSNQYERPFKLLFNKASPIYSKMGQIRSDFISKNRYVENNIYKGCVESYAQFCREFVDRCIKEHKNT